MIFENHQQNDEKCAQRKTFDGEEERRAQKDGKYQEENDNVFEDDFEQLVRELEFVEREAGLEDAFLFLEFDKYYNSWNNPLN